jgi:hypothetical protein
MQRRSGWDRSVKDRERKRERGRGIEDDRM